MSTDWTSHVGPGWANLVNKALEAEKMWPIEIEEVKEKFGGLRVYFHWHTRPKDENWDRLTKEVHGYLDTLETESLRTCEVCGGPGVRRKMAWIKTLCDADSRGALPLELTPA